MASETGGSCPPTFQRGGAAEPGPHFKAFLTSHAMNRFINASKEAMHLPVIQKLVAVAACESFTTRNRSTSCVSILRSLAADPPVLPRAHVYDRFRATPFMNIN